MQHFFSFGAVQKIELSFYIKFLEFYQNKISDLIGKFMLVEEFMLQKNLFWKKRSVVTKTLWGCHKMVSKVYFP